MLIVDAHPHIYSADRRRYPTIDDPWEPGEPATAEDLRRRMAECGVARAVFIQTSTFYGVDNRYICDSALANQEWATGVVTLDPDDDASLAVLERAVTSSNVRGVRLGRRLRYAPHGGFRLEDLHAPIIDLEAIPVKALYFR